MIFLRPFAVFVKNLEVCLLLCPGDGIRRLQIGNGLRDSNSLIRTITSIGRLAHEDTYLAKND